MWVVRVGDDLYVRSAGGPGRPWYRNALASGAGRIRAAGIERDISFASADTALLDAVDDTYHAKYDRYGPGPVSHVTGPDAHEVTFVLSGASHERSRRRHRSRVHRSGRRPARPLEAERDGSGREFARLHEGGPRAQTV